MSKLVAGYFLLFFLASLLSAIYDNGTSLAATKLVTAVDDNDVSMSVRSTQGFTNAGWLEVNSEKIGYNGRTSTSFTNLTRGYRSTSAAAHAAGTMIYSPSTGAMNAGLGFSIASSGSTVGATDIMMFPVNLVRYTVPKLVFWRFSFLSEKELGNFAQYIGWCFSAGFLFILSYYMISAFGGIFQSIFVRR